MLRILTRVRIPDIKVAKQLKKALPKLFNGHACVCSKQDLNEGTRQHRKQIINFVRSNWNWNLSGRENNIEISPSFALLKA